MAHQACLDDANASDGIIAARPGPTGSGARTKSASIVMAVRDERDNIEPMIRAIPKVGSSTEIVIVEGHSRDGTREEIQRVIRSYPKKNIRLVIQSGEGVGNAIFEGFVAATGDVLILLEADRTTNPEDVLSVFNMIAGGEAEFVNGSRFIHPRQRGSMPLLNAIGNHAFARWCGWLIGQPMTDVFCGLKGIDRRQFRRVANQWGFLGIEDPFSDFDMLFGAARLGLTIREVPTRYLKRQYGRTKTRCFKHGWMMARVAARATKVFKCR